MVRRSESPHGVCTWRAFFIGRPMFPEISIKTDLDQLTSWAKLIAADQVPFAAALTLTLTGQDVKAEIEREMGSQFDRATPYTMRGFRLIRATKTKLVATVTFKEDARNYLGPQVYGGDRKAKALERALQALGLFPAGWVVVPAEGARLDQYGNMDRGQVVQVLSQLRITMTAGYSRNMSFDARKQIAAQKKAGGRFFAIKVGTEGKLHPGVYQRELLGRNITPVLLFVRAASYRTRLPIEAIATKVMADRLTSNFATAWQQALATARR